MSSSSQDRPIAQYTNFKMKVKDDNFDHRPKNLDEVDDLQWTADQEILLLYSLHGYKPVGLHKHARMLVIQDRFSNALNKNVSCRAIWKKLNTLYDLEALDEAEAEADATVAVETDFSLPEDELGEFMKAKISGRPIKVEKLDIDPNYVQEEEMINDIKTEPAFTAQENKVGLNNKETLDTPKGATLTKDSKKESLKKGPKKKEMTPTKESITPVKREIIAKESPKKDILGKKEIVKELKKVGMKDEEKKDIGKKSTLENKKDVAKEEKKEPPVGKPKRDSADKKVIEQTKKDVEFKKIEQRKVGDFVKGQRAEPSKARSETPKQLRHETPKRTEAKTLRSETPKPLKAESTPKPQRVEVLKKESSAEKKKEITDKKVESKSPEKSLESRGAKLRTRGKESESDKPETPTGTKRERSRDSISKTFDAQPEEPTVKKSKITAPKGRPTRNSIEPQQKPVSPTVSPTKRRTRLL